MKNVLMIINDGFEEVETITPYDLLKRCGASVTLSSRSEYVKGSHGLTLKSDCNYEDISFDNYDILVLSGGKQFLNNQNDKLYLNAIKYFKENKAVASICATPTILGKLGYLDGINYTLFTPMNKDFNGYFTNAKVETSGNIITSRSCGTAMEFAFAIVKYLYGEDKVDELKEDILY